jgi:arginine repressor
MEKQKTKFTAAKMKRDITELGLWRSHDRSEIATSSIEQNRKVHMYCTVSR